MWSPYGKSDGMWCFGEDGEMYWRNVSEKLPHFQGIDSIPTRNPLVYVNSQKRHHVPFPASSIIIIIHPSNHRSSLSPRNEVLMPLGFGIRPSTRETASTASTLAGQ